MIKRQPLISIITPVLNGKDTIEDTIKSVIGQNYGDIEYIVIDGGSTDGTLEIIEKYKNKIPKFISEPDKGIYDAMNKGINFASGEIIGILNADDFYASNNILVKISNSFKRKNIDCLWGDLVYINRKNRKKIIRYWKSSNFFFGKFKNGWHPPHPTFFVKKSIYSKYGSFNLDFPIAADYELMLRFLEKYKIKPYYIPEILVKMRHGGRSNKNIGNIIKANIECYKAFKANGLKINPLRIFLKPLLKVRQYARI